MRVKYEALVNMAGLSFDNYQRNQYIASKGYAMPKATLTGTTIVGCKFKGGVVVSIHNMSSSDDGDRLGYSAVPDARRVSGCGYQRRLGI